MNKIKATQFADGKTYNKFQRNMILDPVGNLSRRVLPPQIRVITYCVEENRKEIYINVGLRELK